MTTRSSYLVSFRQVARPVLFCQLVTRRVNKIDFDDKRHVYALVISASGVIKCNNNEALPPKVAAHVNLFV